MSTPGGATPARSLTHEQSTAVGAHAVSVALVAGAGTGKTKVLAERYLRLLESPGLERIRSIVTMTFTDKAARELRDRVRHLCRAHARHAEDQAAWRTILWALEIASISTFHAFCGDLLRQFPIEAGVEPGFEVIDDAISATLREDSVRSAVRGWIAGQDQGFYREAVNLGLGTIRDLVLDLVANVAGRNYPDLAERDPDAIVAGWYRIRDQELAPRFRTDFLDLWRPCRALLDAHPCSLATMNRRMGQLREISESIAAGAFSGEVWNQIDPLLVLSGVRSSHWGGEETWHPIRDALKALQKHVRNIIPFYQTNPQAERAQAEQVRTLARLAHEANRAYAARKAAHGYLDFTDLQARTLELLRSARPELLRSIQGSVRFLLVDEFQDTDPVQAEILRRLASGPIGGGILFLVGDAKQSIYGFRGAMPELLQSFRQEFPSQGQLRLTENFRSASEILAFVNRLFEPVFQGDDHRLRAARKVPSGTFGPRVSLVWPQAETPPGDDRAPARRKREAHWLARILASRLEAGWWIHDPARGTPRLATAGDVVFLFRTLNDSSAYERALSDAGLDYFIVGGRAFYAQQEIIDLINLVSAIEDPGDERALLGLLRSAIGGVSDDGLFWLSTSTHGSLIQGLDHAESIDHINNRDRERALRVRSLLREWRSIKDRVPHATLLERALAESGFEEIILAEPLGERKQANCRKLVELARDFDRRGGLTLADLASRMKADRDKPPREKLASTTDEAGNVVRLMTIHQSKGLEFPIVVIPDINRKGEGRKTAIQYRDDLGLIVRSSASGDDDELADGSAAGESSASREGPSLGWMVGKALSQREQEQESHRLFYVAVTRARDYLLLSSADGPAAKKPSEAMTLLSAQFDLGTGRPLDAEREAPWVEVIRDLSAFESTRPAARRRRAPTRVSAARIVAAIERGLAAPLDGRTADLAALAATEVDLRPEQRLPGRPRSLLELIERAMADPAFLAPGDQPLEMLLAAIGARMVPAASRVQLERARERIARLQAFLIANRTRHVAEGAGSDWPLVLGLPLDSASTLLARLTPAPLWRSDRDGARLMGVTLAEFADETEPLIRASLRLQSGVLEDRVPRGSGLTLAVARLAADGGFEIGEWPEREVPMPTAALLRDLVSADGEARWRP